LAKVTRPKPKSAQAHPNSLRENPGGIQRETAKGGCPKVSLLFFKANQKKQEEYKR